MEQMDEERFRRGPHPLGSSAAPSPRPERETAGQQVRSNEDREEILLGAHANPRVAVRGRSLEGRCAVRDELQLLAALEVAGIGAAPAVLETEDGEYTRESAPPLTRRTGRRAAEDGSPPTAERLALSRAREDLDALLDELHQRGWVLGAPAGQGLGVRADGSVVVTDLQGLRREEGLAPRAEDRRWVDTVLQDQQRTLRRRIDTSAPPWAPSAPVDAGSGRKTAMSQELASAGAPAGPPSAGAAVAAAPASAAADDADPAAGGALAQALPAPRRQLRRRRIEPAPRAAPPRTRPLSSALTDALHRPAMRRIAVLSAVTVLLLGGATALGVRWAAQPPAHTPEQQAVQAPAAPEIEDPWQLVADLAGRRHAFVTGVSEVPVAGAGSSALEQDQQTRLAYTGHLVSGGGPVIHEVELLEGPTAQGTARLRAVTSIAEHEIEDPQGQVRTVPATQPAEVLLELSWDGQHWLIDSAQTPPDAGVPGPD
ncbi:hypothetical protein [Brachybacterium massiliense]|uniref:hypothetical protein n=1 Tax=Brachybacterium massiliense TaxID=1755098 RepID=UPI001483872D|nr:hypothetical protein [Brachybacterium massiliense]